MALLLNVTAAGLTSADDVPLITNGTSKSMHDFSQCFISSQERLARALWIVPNEGGGGSISNDGALGVTNPYRIRFTKGAQGNEVEVFITKGDPAEEQTVLKAAKSCW